MKTGIIQIAAVFLICPECDEAISSPNGSEMHTAEEHEALDNEVFCHWCGEIFRKPAFPKQRRRKVTA